MLNLSLAAIIIIIRTLFDAGEFKSIKPHFDGECEEIFEIVGAEDITMIADGFALISSDDRRSYLNGNNIQGNIFLYDIDQKKLINLTPSLDFEFHPHGISTFGLDNGSIQVAVVNHQSDAHAIEIFSLQDQLLTHLYTIKDKLLISPNDLILVDDGVFYMTNDHISMNPLKQKFYDYMQIPGSNVVFYDGKSFRVVARGLIYANGINISHDGSSVYVAQCVGRTLSIFSRNLKTNALEEERSIYLNSAIDNIELDDDGNLWIGSHPKTLAFARHQKKQKKLSPSQVIKITLNEDGDIIEEIFLNDGQSLSGSSVATIHGNQLLIGPVFDERFLHCQMND
tara:strand:- start:416 stop:1435 length:1020 start_codon:yes stop_codon:yes gene_type:complete